MPDSVKLYQDQCLHDVQKFPERKGRKIKEITVKAFTHQEAPQIPGRISTKGSKTQCRQRVKPREGSDFTYGG